MQKFFWLKKKNQQSLDAGGEHRQIHHLSVKESILATCTSSFLATFIMNPLDLILTRFQTTDSTKNKLCVKSIARDIVKNEGYMGYLKGITPRLAIACANSLLILPIYEFCKARYGLPIVDWCVSQTKQDGKEVDRQTNIITPIREKLRIYWGRMNAHVPHSQTKSELFGSIISCDNKMYQIINRIISIYIHICMWNVRYVAV